MSVIVSNLIASAVASIISVSVDDAVFKTSSILTVVIVVSAVVMIGAVLW